MPLFGRPSATCFMGSRQSGRCNNGVDWPWFIASQFIFGVVAALRRDAARAAARRRSSPACFGGLVGGLLMPVPAVLWSLASGHGLWYPANLLAGMVRHGMDHLPIEQLMQFNADWLHGHRDSCRAVARLRTGLWNPAAATAADPRPVGLGRRC